MGIGRVSGAVYGHEGARQFLKLYLTAFPDLHFDIEQILAAGDSHVVIRWRSKGTHRGPLANISATGKSATNHGCTVMELKNSKVNCAWVYFDNACASSAFCHGAARHQQRLRGPAEGPPGRRRRLRQEIVGGRPYKGKDELVQKKVVPKATYDKIKREGGAAALLAAESGVGWAGRHGPARIEVAYFCFATI